MEAFSAIQQTWIQPVWSWWGDVEYRYGISALGVQSFYWKAAVYFAVIVLLFALLEQIRLHRKKGGLNGPWISIPFLGGIVEMIVNPTAFWDRQRVWAATSGGLSWNSLVGIFTVFSAKAKISRKILTKNSPNDFVMWLHPNGVKIFGDHNIAFNTGSALKQLRKSFLNLFTRKALGVYLSIQERLIHQHISKWLQEGKTDVEMRTRLRDLNLMTSQTVFVGPYLEDPEHFSVMYLHITEGFLSAPINLPGTGLWKAIRGRIGVEKVLQRAAVLSKENMSKGMEPRCLLDFWVQRLLEEINEAEAKGETPPEYCTNEKIASVCMDFLFASQDASTASLTQTIALLADHPDILEKVRKEQEEVNPNRETLTYELLEKMVYTRQVMKEILRYHPPAPMVINKAMRDIQLTDDYTCPKGSVVCPSLTAACQEGFTNPRKFDPDRMGPERQEDIKYRENYLVFGTGPHMCVGREYAMNHLVAFLSILSTTCVWTRKYTPNSHKVVYLPTIYPADCLITLKPKED